MATNHFLSSMKIKFLVLFTSIFFSLSISAQREVTTFMGIPIDGTTENMIRELNNKNFKLLSQHGYNGNIIMEGMFNGDWAQIMIFHNRNLVHSIVVSIRLTGAKAAKTAFNHIHAQMSRSWKYWPHQDSSIPYIPNNADIDYELRCDNDKYKLDFSQVFTQSIQVEALKQTMVVKGINPDEYTIQEKNKELFAFNLVQKQQKHTAHLINELSALEDIDSHEFRAKTNELNEAMKNAENDAKKDLENRVVSISLKRILMENFAILITYTNPYNFPNGEDL